MHGAISCCNTLNKFKDVSVHMGSFHILLSYVASLGKVMRWSRIEDIFIESGICTRGPFEVF